MKITLPLKLNTRNWGEGFEPKFFSWNRLDSTLLLTKFRKLVFVGIFMLTGNLKVDRHLGP